MKPRDLKVGLTVSHEIRLGQDLTKRRIGVIVEVGARGALVEFVDRRFQPTWLRSGQLSRLSASQAADEVAVAVAEEVAARIQPRTVYRHVEIMELAPPPPEPLALPEPQEAPPVSNDKTKTSLPASIIPPDLGALERAGLDPWAMYAALGQQLQQRARADALAAEALVAKCDAAVREAEDLLTEYKKAAAQAREELREKLALAEKVTGK